MSARHAKILFFLLIVLVTLLFFVHDPSGGFQSRNGPTTPINNLRFLVFSLLLLLAAKRSSESLLAFISSNLARFGIGPLNAFRIFPGSTSLRC
ncbi:MAG TPA: hypothetical protein VFR84_08255 [Candidatus Angelobacter sp.]|nr:hypothetical protein [Candidatus Angelobacter sp.]